MSRHRWFSRAHASVKLVASLLIPAAMSLIGASAAAAAYTVVELATLSQGMATVVRGPNSAGVAVGAGRLVSAGSVSGGRRGLVFRGAGGVQQITGFADSDDAAVFAINDVGTFVGSSNTATAIRAFIGTQPSGLREL